MALILKDRVQETSTTTGTGTLTLAGAVTQFQTFSSAIGNGNTTYYTIYNAGGSDWEVGIGTVGAGTLARTTVLASSNANALVNFTGTLYVFGDYPAGKSVYQDANGEITGTTINATTKFVAPDFYAQSVLGGNLRTYTGTSLLNWDGGGSGNVTVNGGLIADPANKNINLSPTGTGNVVIAPATAGSMDNMVIGGTTPKAITGTTVTATTFSGSGASLTSIPNSALVNSAITINGTSTSLGGSISVGTVTSVTGTAPVVSSGGATPAISMAAANGTTNGYLTSTDWNTFNGKGSGTVTSVGGTGTVSGISLSGTVTSSGNLTLGGALDLSAPPAIGGTTPNAITGTTVAATASVSGSSSKGAFNYGTLGYSDTNHLATFQTSVNSYSQVEIQNTNAGASASADMIVANNLTTATTYYGDFGMNSSAFSGTGALGAANNVYLTATTGDLAIGTTTSNAIHFVVNGGATDAAKINTNNTTTITAIQETQSAISASAIDLTLGNYFTKTISGTTTFTISNTASSGTVNSFILDLTNGGSATVNWWSGVKWAGGTAPTLTSSGRDVLGFFTEDGGTTWNGFVLGKAMS